MPTTTKPYIGRFAPTPSGPLHLGTIIAALAGYLEARSRGGKWLLRFDDLDTPRIVPGATDRILDTLEQLCMEWDDEVCYQNRRTEYYEDALQALMQSDQVYRCYCPRRLTKGIPYPGTCRGRKDPPLPSQGQYSLRIRTNTAPVRFRDRIQGRQQLDISQDSGDFIVLRADKIFAYHLATAVDDSLQGITEVIRGADLLDSTPKQLYLQSLLQLPAPNYGHVPVLIDALGTKISKRQGAMDVLLQDKPGRVLYAALSFLGQGPEPDLVTAGPAGVMAWARQNWSLASVPRIRSGQLARGLLKPT